MCSIVASLFAVLRRISKCACSHQLAAPLTFLVTTLYSRSPTSVLTVSEHTASTLKLCLLGAGRNGTGPKFADRRRSERGREWEAMRDWAAAAERREDRVLPRSENDDDNVLAAATLHTHTLSQLLTS